MQVSTEGNVRILTVSSIKGTANGVNKAVALPKKKKKEAELGLMCILMLVKRGMEL